MSNLKYVVTYYSINNTNKDLTRAITQAKYD